MSSETPDTPPTRTQVRLGELLQLLRTAPPQPPARLAADVVKAARFERGVRSTSRTLTSFGAAIFDGLVVLLGLKRGR